MMRKAIWIICSLLVVFGIFFVSRDAIVGIILEKHTVRTCGKLLGGSCTFGSRERDGSTLVLRDVQVQRDNQSAEAKDILIHWEYGWSTPFVTFDVKVNHLQGDAGMLPLYGVWKAVRHASARKGFRLRSWTFDDVALKTSDGHVKFPVAFLEGRGGKVQAAGRCYLPTQGEMDISGSHDGSWNVSLRSASIPEIVNLLQCWSGQAAASIHHLEGQVSADLHYTNTGLKGSATVHSFSYGTPELALANLSLAVQTDRSLKEWQFDGQLGTPALHFSALLTRGGQRLLTGTLSGRSVPVRELLEVGGYRPAVGEWEGDVDIEGEFDEKGLFASFTPRYLRWDFAETPIVLYPVSTSGKLWINFSKGLERLWLNMREARLRWGEVAEARIQGDVEIGKKTIIANNLKACCGDIVLEGALLANSLSDGSSIIIAEGDKTKIGAWNIQRMQAKLSPRLEITEWTLEGKAEAANIQKDLKKLGIEWKDANDFPGKIKMEATYTAPANLTLKGKWEADLLAAEGVLQGTLDKDDRIDLNEMDVAMLIPKVGKIARYSLAEGNGNSFIDLSERYLELNGRLHSSGPLAKSFQPKAFKISGPWNKLSFERSED